MTDSDIFRTECIRPIQPERPQTEKFHRQAMEFFSDSHLPACLDELVFPTFFGLDPEFRAAILVDDRDTHQVLGRDIGKQDVACRRDVCLAIMGNDVSAYEVAFVRS